MAEARLRRLLPSRVQLWGLVFLTLLAVFIGNSKQLIDYYGLAPTTSVITASAGHTITHGLGKLDSFSFTDDAVTFGIWSLAGLFCLSVFRIIRKAYAAIRYEEDISSNRFVHPLSFSRSQFWRQVLLDFLGLISYLALFGMVLYVFFVFVLPIGLVYTQAFLLDISLRRIGEFALGLFILFSGVCALYVCIKLLLNRHHLFELPK